MAIRVTRGEWRGLLVLGAVLAALLALMAWHRSSGRMVDADVYELPGRLAERADSLGAATADSVARPGVCKQKKIPRKRVRGNVVDRPSPLDV